MLNVASAAMIKPCLIGILLFLSLSRSIYGCPFCEEKPYDVDVKTYFLYWGVDPWPTSGSPWGIEIGEKYSKKWTAVLPAHGHEESFTINLRQRSVKVRVFGSGFFGSEVCHVSIKVPCGVRAVRVNGHPEITVRSVRKLSEENRRFFEDLKEELLIGQEARTSAAMAYIVESEVGAYWVQLLHNTNCGQSGAGLSTEFDRTFTVEFLQ